MSLGKKFKQKREEKGLSLKDIQSQIKVRTRYLEAIENEDFDIIPGQAYVRAFIKGYADELGLNSKDILQEYQNMCKEEEKIKEAEENQKEKKKEDTGLLNNKRFLRLLIVAVVMLVIFILIIIFLLFHEGNESNLISEDISEIDNIQQEEIYEEEVDLLQENRLDSADNNLHSVDTDSTDDRASLETNSNDAGVITENVNNDLSVIIGNNNNANNFDYFDDKEFENLEIIFIEQSWIKILVDDKLEYEGTFEAGTILEIEVEESLDLRIGNSSGVYIKKDNENLGPWGEHGEVVQKSFNFLVE